MAISPHSISETTLSDRERDAISQTAEALSAAIVVDEPDERLAELRARPDTVCARPTLGALAAERDVGGTRLMRLIVDPGLRPDAFQGSGTIAAEARWSAFLRANGAESVAELNARAARGATPYTVDLNENSGTLGVLRESGRMIHAGLTLRDVIAVPIRVPSGDDQHEEMTGAITIAASVESAGSMLEASLGERVEIAGASAERCRAFTPPAGPRAAGAIAIREIALASLAELAELRSIALGLRAERPATEASVPPARAAGFGEWRSVALASHSEIGAP